MATNEQEEGQKAAPTGLDESLSPIFTRMSAVPVRRPNSTGCLSLGFTAGLAIVRAHNRWAVLVTLAGWFALALGLFRMFAACRYQRSSANISATVFLALEGILLILGLVMTFKAYSRDDK